MKKISLIALLLSLLSCTDLVEKSFSEVQPKAYFTNEKSIESIATPAYAQLHKYVWNYWLISELPSDELLALDREYANDFKLLSYQEFYPQLESPNLLWNECYDGIGACNNGLYLLKEVTNFEQYKAVKEAELRTLRAFYYYQLMDIFGNVPLTKSIKEQNSGLPQTSRAELFDFCVQELNEAIKALPDKAEYARVNKRIAQTLLAKILLNGVIYRNQEKWAECNTVCDEIIKSGQYQLEPNYYTNFKTRNENSKETILPIGFSSNIDLGFPNMNLYMMTLHYNQMPASPWNGFATVAEVYDSFAENDVRRKTLWLGDQYSDLTWPEKSTKGTLLKTRRGDQLSFTKGPFTNTWQEEAGIRVPKYEPDLNAPGGQGENDFLIFRYADIIIAKAEALVHLSRNEEALQLVNQIRERAGIEKLTKINLDLILEERGREFYWEGLRRQDQIRFGKFQKINRISDGSKITFKKTELHKALYPIPSYQMMLNPKLKQNPGY